MHDRLGDDALVLVDHAHGHARASPCSGCREKMKPKNDAMAMGAAKLMITARRSVKKSSRSLRTMARHAWSAISPSGCGR